MGLCKAVLKTRRQLRDNPGRPKNRSARLINLRQVDTQLALIETLPAATRVLRLERGRPYVPSMTKKQTAAAMQS